MNALEWAVAILLIVGAINWGLYGLANTDLVKTIFGSIPALAKAVYALVGLAGLFKLYKIVTSK